MVRGMLERVVSADKLNALFSRVANKQYTRELMFSTVFDLMCHVVCVMRPSIHAAYTSSLEGITIYGTLICL